MIVVDSDVLIEILEKGSDIGDVALKKIGESGEDFAITAITMHEVMYGILNYSKDSSRIETLPVLSYAKEDAKLSAQLELGAERSGKKIRRTDSMIAAVVINNGAKLYTLDKKHFEPLKSSGLKLF